MVHTFLAPDENIKYESDFPVEFNGDNFNFYLTNKRLIWHKKTGLIFRKNHFIAETIERVQSIQFKEEGLFIKKGTMIIVLGDREKQFSGKLSNMKALYGEVQALMNI